MLTEDEQAIMETAREYCREQLAPRVLEAYRHESKLAMPRADGGAFS